MRKSLAVVGAALAAALAYLLAWPVPIEPVAWAAPLPPGYAGPHAVNQRLAGLKSISLGNDEGPEHIVLGPDGWLYTTVASGAIVRMARDGSQREVWARTGGRVLGFDFDSAGNLIAADAFRGLLSIAAGPDRAVRVLADTVTVNGKPDPIRYADAVVVAPDGRMYFSDASTRFAPAQWGGTFEASVLDILEQRATGRVLVYEPDSGRTRVMAAGLSFANGVALTADARHLLVAETGRYRVWKIAIDARDLDLSRASPQAQVLLDNLPGYPDNLMRGLDGKTWMGFAKPRNAVIDRMAAYPWLRSLTLRLPRAIWPIPPAYGHVVAFDDSGRILADLQDPSGTYPETTAVTETADRLYIQSLHARSLGWMPRPGAAACPLDGGAAGASPAATPVQAAASSSGTSCQRTVAR